MHQSIPTPVHASVQVGIVTIHFYALMILLGIVAAMAMTISRARHRGIDSSLIYDLAIVVIPSGIVGGRLYHVITSPSRYFGDNGSPADVVKIWQGGMGIWGAIALAVFAGWLRLRHTDINFPIILDLVAPGLLLAQSIGRWGNWFNGELFGAPTKVAWALEIPYSLRPEGYQSFETFHPTFLYESLWCLIGVFILMKLKLGRHGSLFLAYIAWYCTGRTLIELIRVDTSTYIFGMRFNFWVSLLGILFSTFALANREKSRKRQVG